MGVHSDGQNAVEENGIPSLLTMAKYFAALPLCKRKYSLGFAAVTGHMDYDVPEPGPGVSIPLRHRGTA